MPRREPGRTVRIAALRDLAQWFEDNPDVPMPTNIDMRHHITPDDEIDAGLRVAAVRAAGARPQAHMDASGTSMWAIERVPAEGIDVTYALHTVLTNYGRWA